MFLAFLWFQKILWLLVSNLARAAWWNIRQVQYNVVCFKFCSTEEMPMEDPEPCHQKEKFLVFKWQLLQLFQFCQRCHFPVRGVVDKRVGTCIHIVQKCSACKYVNNWASQPYIGKMPAGNLLLSGFILYSGCLSSSCLLMFKL